MGADGEQSPSKSKAAAISMVTTFRTRFGTSSIATPVPIGSSRCGWRGHERARSNRYRRLASPSLTSRTLDCCDCSRTKRIEACCAPYSGHLAARKPKSQSSRAKRKHDQDRAHDVDDRAQSSGTLRNKRLVMSYFAQTTPAKWASNSGCRDCDLLSTLPSLVKNPRFQARGFFSSRGVTSALGNGSLFCHGVKLLTIALSPRRVFLRSLPHGAATR